MVHIVSVTGAARRPPESAAALASYRATELERSVRTFLEIAAAIELSHHEECTMLDLTSREMALLRLAPPGSLPFGGGKLERRVAYAIPILQRMIASMAC